MKKETRVQAINNSYEDMMKAHYMAESAVTPFQKNVAEILYDLSWAVYQILTDKDRKGDG